MLQCRDAHCIAITGDVFVAKKGGTSGNHTIFALCNVAPNSVKFIWRNSNMVGNLIKEKLQVKFHLIIHLSSQCNFITCFSRNIFFKDLCR